MKENKKMIKKKIIIYLVFISILCYILYTIYLLIKQPTNVFTIEEGKLYEEETDIGYVIRNEKIVKGENYKNGIMQIKLEGERASKEENIFRYYSANEETLKKKIEDLDSKIQEVMLNDNSIFTSDMKLLEQQIDEKVENISQIMDTTTLAEYKKEINDLVSKKAKIAGSSSQSGEYIQDLTKQKEELENELTANSEDILAPSSGVVSYRVDGLENVLTPNDFSSLTEQSLENLELKTGKIVSTSTENRKNNR